MSEKTESSCENNMAISETICRTESSVVDGSAPTGRLVNFKADLASRDACGDIEQLEKKRKTRRRKTKRKNPYNKILNPRGKKALKPRSVNQPVAPYNSNQFLIEDHNDLQDFDVKLMAVSAANRAENQNGTETQRTGRQRDPSFTSAESDQEFYSSPEDEEEFLTKEFSNTYQDLHVESLAAMSKSDLIQTVLQLEEKVDSLEKRLGSKSLSCEDRDKEVPQNDKEKYFQSEICKLVHANEELLNENEKLRKQSTSQLSSGSSEDSESDSSTSSDSSEMSQSEDEDTKYERMNGEMECDTDANCEPSNIT